jgi:hypothetical protein
VTKTTSLAEFTFMKKGPWVAEVEVVGKGRFSLQSGFEVAALGLKGGESWRRFRQGNFKNTSFSKPR